MTPTIEDNMRESTDVPKMPLWLPNNIEATTPYRFMQFVSKRQSIHLATYHDLHAWSVHKDTADSFWELAYEFLELQPPDSCPTSTSTRLAHLPMFPPPRYFPAAKINIAEIIFRATKTKSRPLIHFARDGTDYIEEVTSENLKSRTRQIYDALVSSGVKLGDRVACVASNSVTTIALCLATLAIGAIWSSTSCDSGAAAIVARFEQIQPKIVFADDAYVYAGKLVKLGDRIVEWSNILGRHGGLQHVVIIPSWGIDVDVSEVYRGLKWQEFHALGKGRAFETMLLPFHQPAFILFSSGTTGKPKCIVHSSGAIALKTNVDAQLQHDIRSSDVVFQFTTTAWVMWVLNFASLAVGASMLLYDGSPFHPKPDILLELAERLGVTVFGTSPRYLMELRSRGIIPRQMFRLDKLRIVTSTGAVLNSDIYDWFYKTAFPLTTHLISMSGGTDIAGTFVGGTPLLPVYAGEIQAKSLGMAIDIFDSGLDRPLSIASTGQPGELVCTSPFPSQPVKFLGFDGQEKYRKSYFSRFGLEVWCQGDSIMLCPDTKGLIIVGRSDGVLDPSGVRFGPAEIYAVTETFTTEIEDALCVGQRRQDDEDEAVLLFIKLKSPLQELESGLVTKIKSAIRDRYSPRHVPTHVFKVADIPYTSNGKKCEINVKHIINGIETEIGSTVVNPESFKLYRHYLKLPKITIKANKKLKSKI
ncbi:hypothetical protein LTS08_007814 [Lithohypha guttulata]|nr:hypothetical protein LTS08_007814 [Lithohypha guttulata]